MKPDRPERGSGLQPGLAAPAEAPSSSYSVARRRFTSGQPLCVRRAVQLDRDLFPRAAGFGQLAAKLCTAAELFEHGQPVLSSVALRPDLECRTACGGRVPIRMHLAETLGRFDQEGAGVLALACCEPVLGCEARLCAALFEQRGRGCGAESASWASACPRRALLGSGRAGRLQPRAALR